MGMYVERFKQQQPDAERIVAGIYVTGIPEHCNLYLWFAPDGSFAGKVIDSSLLNDLPAGADICGEWAIYRMQS